MDEIKALLNEVKGLLFISLTESISTRVNCGEIGLYAYRRTTYAVKQLSSNRKCDSNDSLLITLEIA